MVELVVVDGGSTDGSLEKLQNYGEAVDCLISEADQGPADAINKGFANATGDVVAWLNTDDRYLPGTLARVQDALAQHPEAAFAFGHCPIVDLQGTEIRKGITWFKEMFFPISSHFTFQCINYLSQPACFFRRSAAQAAGPLRLDLKAAWDYEFLLRMWRQGKGVRVPSPALAQFCWHEGSISGQHFRRQFDEEFQAARADAGMFSLQTFLHFGVKWGIIGAYSLMEWQRRHG
ncbi:PGL/p-HBAD biosynthesis glycosyltransferase [Thiorhodovibrio litoralis]|nr:PGL/p-HBAD biosynthesis glycosyltransferase [Thiorhodovibrio litoralis]